MFLDKVCASLMPWAVNWRSLPIKICGRLNGCVMSDAGHESHAAATISQRNKEPALGVATESNGV